MEALLWLDLETTGLDPSEDQILELAFQMTDMELNELSEVRSFLTCAPDDELMGDIDPVVLEMHTVNGLWDALHDSTTNDPGDYYGAIDLVWPEFYTAVASLVSVNKVETLYLAGSSVHFDYDFLRFEWKDNDGFNSMFHHRFYDVSAIKLFLVTLGDEYPHFEPVYGPVHRAGPDVQNSIHEAALLVERLAFEK